MDEQTLYDLVLSAPPEQRTALIESICKRSPHLRDPLERLLAVHSLLHEASPTPPSKTPPPLRLREGRVVSDRYRILEKIGEGGMGEVYLADDLRLESKVAVKFLRGTPDKAADARFRREAKIAARLQNPDLCPAIDLGDFEGETYLVMPYIAGETLANRLARIGRLEIPTALLIARRIAVAAAAAHRAGIVHRDLKPGNILLRKEPHDAPMIMDFGLARRFDRSDGSLTQEGIVVGTPRYMPPEQAAGLPVGPTGDVYALGAILFEMVRGGPAGVDRTRPIDASESPQAEDRQEGDAAALRLVRKICRKALAPNPLDRYQSMVEFAAVIDQVRSAVEPQATDDFLPKAGALATTAIATSSSTVRWRIGTAAAALAAVAIVVFLYVQLRPAGRQAAGKGEQPARGDQPSARDSGVGLTAGSIWRGDYHFRATRGMTDEEVRKSRLFPGDAALSVLTRQGNRFTGRYETLKGSYAWEISGTFVGGRLDATFTSVLREPKAMNVIGSARLRGAMKEGKLELVFDQGKDTADMVLERVKAD